MPVCECVSDRRMHCMHAGNIMHACGACKLARTLDETRRMPTSWDGHACYVCREEANSEIGLLTVSETNEASQLAASK